MSIDIIVINDFAGVNGGAAQVALASAFALAARGHRVTFFSANTPNDERRTHPNLRVILTDQHEIATDPNRLRAAVQGVWNAKAKRLLRETLNEFDANHTIVHLHGWSKALSSSVVRECTDRRFAVVCTIHDYFLACPNGGFYNFQTNQICTLSPLSLNCVGENCDSRSYPQKLWRVGRQLAQRYAGGIPDRLSAFISVSNFSHAVLKPYLPEEIPVYSIPNPVVSEKSAPADIADQAPFIYVGRFSPEKGGDLLARAAAELDCDVLYVGEGPEQESFRLLNPRARFTGWLPRSGVLQHMRNARALVLPSRWYETQGMVVLEAAAHGVPAIVPDTSSARDLVDDRRTGLWFKSGDVSSLRDAMNLLTRIEYARDLGRAAYDHYWRNPPTIDNHTSKLEEAYMNILQRAAA